MRNVTLEPYILLHFINKEMKTIYFFMLKIKKK